MSLQDSNLHLFRSPMMRLSIFHLRAMVWIVESVDIKTKKSSKIKDMKTKQPKFGKQSFNLCIAHIVETKLQSSLMKI